MKKELLRDNPFSTSQVISHVVHFERPADHLISKKPGAINDHSSFQHFVIWISDWIPDNWLSLRLFYTIKRIYLSPQSQWEWSTLLTSIDTPRIFYPSICCWSLLPWLQRKIICCTTSRWIVCASLSF